MFQNHRVGLPNVLDPGDESYLELLDLDALSAKSIASTPSVVITEPQKSNPIVTNLSSDDENEYPEPVIPLDLIKVLEWGVLCNIGSIIKMAGVEGQNENDASDSMRIMLDIQDMASAIRETNQHNHESHQETQDDQIRRIQGEFRKTRPPVFKGDANPMAAEEWLRQIMRKMNEQRVPENLKVTIASTYLKGQVYHWREFVLAMPDVEIATWVAFETIFLEKYFPETMITIKVREFTNLCQGDMTVGQYQTKFEELMCFAAYMIPNESTKAKKFEEGLRLEVNEKVELFKLKKYVEVVDHALMAEQRILSSNRVLEPKNLNWGQSSKRQIFSPLVPSIKMQDNLRQLKTPDFVIFVGK
ncbi:unnamed protein product [Prunus armeniaca]|uniref:AGC-kinase C-terminal domain-containing protein n=1 Tax=Prunus armeniaca TaxID=36596 RepID=A0A6J5W0I5_PRUAR|nr:unnamed protein product [Prunus armeniaca]CAB4293993.1 unnamed protein product [Prunus armeniaca]